jgi:hypothetical protein
MAKVGSDFDVRSSLNFLGWTGLKFCASISKSGICNEIPTLPRHRNSGRPETFTADAYHKALSSGELTIIQIDGRSYGECMMNTSCL